MEAEYSMAGCMSAINLSRIVAKNLSLRFLFLPISSQFCFHIDSYEKRRAGYEQC